MTEIRYSVGDISGKISWVASEYFGELTGRTFYLKEMEAEQINQLEGLTAVGKLLLSAVAGAVIQHLLDQGVESKIIFGSGEFRVLATDGG